MLLKGAKKDFFASRSAFFETFKGSGPLVKTRSFLTIKQANFYVVSKFCVEAVSQKFSCIFNGLQRKPAFNTYFNSLAYTVSQTLIHNNFLSRLKPASFLRDKKRRWRYVCSSRLCEQTCIMLNQLPEALMPDVLTFQSSFDKRKSTSCCLFMFFINSRASSSKFIFISSLLSGGPKNFAMLCCLLGANFFTL